MILREVAMLTIMQGTLSSLAIYTFAKNFERNSPYYDMLPSAGDFVRHPIDATRMLLEVIRLDELHTSAIVAEKRARHVDDVEKRTRYRKAHGLPAEMGIGTLLGFETKREPTEQQQQQPVAAVGAGAEPPPSELGVADEVAQGPRRKFLGIF